MAEFIWEGNGAGTKTDMQDGRNWIDRSGTKYAQALYPGATAGVNDELLFLNALGSYSAPSTNTDFSAKVAFKSVTVGEAYNSTLGLVASDFKFDMIASGSVVIDAQAASDLYLYGSGSYGITGLRLLGGPISGKKLYLDGKITDPVLLKGTAQIEATATVVNSLTAAFVSSPLTDLTLTIVKGATLPTTVTHLGGNVYNSNAITNLNSSGGTWNQLEGAITTLTGTGSTIPWTDGNITTALVYSGKLDGSGSAKVRHIGMLKVYGSASANLDPGADCIYVGSYTQMFGGTIKWPQGQKLEESFTKTGDGGSNAALGILPQSVAGTPTTTSGSDCYLGSRESVDILVQLGASDATSVVFQAYESEDASHTNEAALTGKLATFTAASKQALITVARDDMATLKPIVRIKAVVTGGAASLISAAYLKHTR